MIQMISHPTSPISPRETAMRKAAQELEVTFLSTILESAGLGKTSESFGGGAGEDQFASFLRRSQAEQMASAGGIGLAEHLFNALNKGPNNVS